MINKLKKDAFSGIVANFDVSLIENYTYKQLLNLMIIFYENEKQDLSDIILNYLNSKQLKSGDFDFKDNFGKTYSPVLYLNYLTKYMLLNENLVKLNLKFIKRAVDYLEINFDNVYLLVKSYDYDSKPFFSAIDNSVVLSFCDDLSELLNKFDYNDIADIIFLLKGKIELGFSRYFLNKKFKLVISSFYSNADYEIANNLELLEIYRNYSFDEIYFKKDIKKIQSNLLNLEYVKYIVYVLFFIKENNSNNFEKEVLSLRKYFSSFPQKIISEKNFNEIFEIKHSINKDIEIKFKKIIKNKVLFDINSLDSQISIYNLLRE